MTLYSITTTIAQSTTTVRAISATEAESIAAAVRGIIATDKCGHASGPVCTVYQIIDPLREAYPYNMGGRIAPNNIFNAIARNLTADFIIAHMRNFARLGNILVRIIATSPHLSARTDLSRVVEDYCLESLPTFETMQWMSAQILHNVSRERFLSLFAGNSEIVWAVQQAAPAEFIARISDGIRTGDDLPTQTPLSLACQHGRAQTVDLLLSAQIPRDQILIDHLAFKAALDGNHWQIAYRLLQAGARIRRAKSIVHRIVEASTATSSRTRDAKSAEILLAYLFAHGIRAQSRTLIVAAKSVRIDLMRDLLNHGADPNEPTDGQFAFTEACKREHDLEDIWHLFIGHGANPHLTTFASPKSAYEETIECLGRFPHRYYGGVWDMIRRFNPAPAFLLGLKETPEEPSEETGDSPVALLRGFPNIVEFILSCGSRRADKVELF